MAVPLQTLKLQAPRAALIPCLHCIKGVMQLSVPIDRIPTLTCLQCGRVEYLKKA